MFFGDINQQKIGMQSIENKTLSDAKSKSTERYYLQVISRMWENGKPLTYYRTIDLIPYVCRVSPLYAY